MKLKRVVDLPNIIEIKKVYRRICTGAMTYYEDDNGYVCYDEEEYINFTPRKSGRKPKMSKLTNQNK